MRLNGEVVGDTAEDVFKLVTAEIKRFCGDVEA